MSRIVTDIAEHCVKYPAFQDREEIIELFLEAFAQDPMVAERPVEDDDVDAGSDETAE